MITPDTGNADFLTIVQNWIERSSNVSTADDDRAMEDWQVQWDAAAKLLIVRITQAGATGHIFLYSWDQGIRWATDWSGALELMPGARDPGLPVLSPGVAWAEAWRDRIPADVQRILTRFATGRWGMLHWASRSLGALELLRNAPKLLWLLLLTAEREEWPEQRIEQCLGRKRREILGACGLDPSASAVRLLSKMHFDSYGATAYAWLRHCLGDAESVRQFCAYPAIHCRQLGFLRLYPDYATTRLVQQAPDDAAYFHELTSLLRDTRQLAAQLRDDASVLARIHQCPSWGALQRLHDRLVKRLHRAPGLPSVLGDDAVAMCGTHLERESAIPPDHDFGPPPIPGNAAILPISSFAALAQEGLKQQHCVVTYHERIQAHHYYVYQVLEPERCTLGLNLRPGWPPRIEQLQGYRNAAVSATTRQTVQDWVDAALGRTTRNDQATEANLESLPRVFTAMPHVSPSCSQADNERDDHPLIRLLDDVRYPDETEEFQVAMLAIIGVGEAGSAAVAALHDGGIEGVQLACISPRARCVDRQTPCTPPTMANPPEIDQAPLGIQPAPLAFGPWLGRCDLVTLIGTLSSHEEIQLTQQILEICRQSDRLLTVVIALQPWPWAGEQHHALAEHGRRILQPLVDAVITLPRATLTTSGESHWNEAMATAAIHQELDPIVRCIMDTITQQGLVGVDFKDVCDVLYQSGNGRAAVGFGNGPQRAASATQQALTRLASDCEIYWAKGLLVCITSGPDISINEFDEVVTCLCEERPVPADLIVSMVIYEHFPPGVVRVTIIAAGVEECGR